MKLGKKLKKKSMSHPQQETKQEALLAPKTDLVKSVFPVLSLFMLMLHIAMFSFSLPLAYYLMGLTLSLISIKDMFSGHLETKKIAGFSCALIATHLFFSLKLSFSFSFQLVALGWISSFVIGLLGQNVAILENIKQRHLLMEKENNYQVALKSLREQVKTQDSKAKEQQHLFETKYQTKAEENSEISKLLEQNHQQYQVMFAELNQLKTLAQEGRNQLITLKGQLSESQLLLNQSQREGKTLKEIVSQLQNEVNYFRVEHEHRGAMFDVLALKEKQAFQKQPSSQESLEPIPAAKQPSGNSSIKAQQTSPVEKPKQPPAAKEPASFTDIIKKLTKDQQQYQTALKACTEEITLIKKQLKGKKKDPEFEERLKEKEQRSIEIKNKLNDINRKIFILKKQQIEEEKVTPREALTNR